METSGGDVELSLRALAILNTFGAVRDTVGQGMFPDGTLALPALRFIADQDTGARRVSDNVFSLVSGAVDRLLVKPEGVDLPTSTTTAAVTALTVRDASSGAQGGVSIAGDMGGNRNHGLWMRMGYSDGLVGATDVVATVAVRGWVAGAERWRIDANGNLLVGTTSASNHLFAKSTTEGNPVFQIVAAASGTRVAQFNGTAQEGFNGARAALWLGKDSTTGRSGGFAGTVNASGADYAEYMLKAAGCGLIAKGDVCGVDRDGRLTKTWADAVSFVIKSTDPSLVGGDTWDAEVGPKPEQPGAEPVEPAPPVRLAADADDAAIAAWREAMAAYPAQFDSYQVAHAEWQKATDAYAKALPVWEAAHEKARQCVDRIAFCGQVPANVTGDFKVGDYIIAAASGAGIKAVAVKADDMTLAQYMRRIGKVWAIRDGRAWIDVQHG
ncbi:hypothetical protein ACQVP2_35625 [Methylobacterium aquaticum]|uniref:hypothetical protein n=1 Tax=Methylobacterium aquaticum TaxID=270351 RepID=UPI003D17000F